MQALWVSLKDNVRCGNKLSDVITMKQPAKCGKGSSYVSEKEKMNGDNNGPLMETPASNTLGRLYVKGSSYVSEKEKMNGDNNGPLMETPASNTLGRLYELSIGDSSRKIVEMVFQKAWMNTSMPVRKVITVLRVSYSAEVLERFEKYREKVKKNACEQYPRHPRSTVDGNELLRLYVTTMICFQGKPAKKVYDLCKDPSCRLCQIIQFNFNTEYAEIQLTTSDKELSHRTTTNARVKNVKRAAIVCRVIAGTAVNEVDGENEGSNSTQLGETQFSLEKFVVKNPSSILPCFVIMFS